MAEPQPEKVQPTPKVWQILQLVGWATAFGGVALAIIGEGNAGLIGLALIVAGIADIFLGKYLALRARSRD